MAAASAYMGVVIVEIVRSSAAVTGRNRQNEDVLAEINGHAHLLHAALRSLLSCRRHTWEGGFAAVFYACTARDAI